MVKFCLKIFQCSLLSSNQISKKLTHQNMLNFLKRTTKYQTFSLKSVSTISLIPKLKTESFRICFDSSENLFGNLPFTNFLCHCNKTQKYCKFFRYTENFLEIFSWKNCKIFIFQQHIHSIKLLLAKFSHAKLHENLVGKLFLSENSLQPSELGENYVPHDNITLKTSYP